MYFVLREPFNSGPHKHYQNGPHTPSPWNLCKSSDPYNFSTDLSEDLLELLGNTTLRNMHIVQNKYTEHARSLHYKAWKACRENNPKLRVHLRVEGNSKKGIVWQPRAPVKSIVYDSPYAQISTPVLMEIVDLYKGDLEIFAYKQLPRFYMPRSFHDRVDSSLLLLVRQCPYINTLMIREKISTATVLLLTYTAKNLQLIGPAVPIGPQNSIHGYCKNSRSYEAMEREVSQMLGCRWQGFNRISNSKSFSFVRKKYIFLLK
ncbi:hypothetical protein Avbf_03218 [Armadillidium vulgare]|nr:hypothetical protein Avbf_03218 [Armadillidium vulgare]